MSTKAFAAVIDRLGGTHLYPKSKTESVFRKLIGLQTSIRIRREETLQYGDTDLHQRG